MASESISVADYISTVCSVIAAVFGLVTVVTVVVAVRQLLTEHRAYASGLSQQALGPWHDKVRTRRLLGLQQEINTPTITVPSLLKANWNPQFVFPGAPASTPQDGRTDPEKALAKASWVNFLAAIGVKLNDQNLYQMSPQPNLVNGIVPMRWEGKSLAAICSLLGFQSSEQKPSFKEPMKLPMHWTGPLGWLQFREGPNGCIVEYRRRALIADQISPEVHLFFKSVPQRTEDHSFVARLWRSINGMMIGDKKALYLGGTDERSERRAKRREAGENLEKTGSDDSRPDFDGLMKGKTGAPTEKRNLSTASTTVATPHTPIPDAGLKRREDDDLFEDLMKAPSKEDIMKKLRNPNNPRGKDESDWETELDAELGGLRDMLRRMREKGLGKMEVFVPCEGLLSVVVQGELANSRGLSIQDCTEYSRAYVDYDDVNQKRTPYRLGDLFMDEDLLKLMKQAVGFIKPDGFYFTPTKWLASDVAEVYRHINRACENPKNEEAVFPELQLKDWPTTCNDRECLHYTMVLCNNFQHIRLHGRAHFTIGDMVVIGKASRSLPKVADLVWSMLISPDLFNDLNRAFNRSIEEFKAPRGWDFLDAEVSCSNGVLNCTDLMRSCGVSRDDDIKYATTASTPPAQTDPMDYTVPLCSNNTFQGSQVLASFLDVLVTHFWVEKSWITDVESYDHVIPQTITMC
ncbi:hypothetical protein QBC33DRAFT_613519 [Phialemonium atrogriseum]|uniref:Uncharacterized protein n=1 Tax=Phialemonium atrogriseum TaxID=1093897 RepID=A0AAJ0BSS1_9PEZI|nr:uncharacterized protein QBC33DRAFT_613519 [Phialemonium atrogriseum]KAK1763630.1 hypothetical protein QBC33DRAFT_613519 [Phialemonium atrogriseum]